MIIMSTEANYVIKPHHESSTDIVTNEFKKMLIGKDNSMSIISTETSNPINSHPAFSTDSYDNINTISSELTDKTLQLNLNLKLNLSVEHRMAVYGNLTQRYRKIENNAKIDNLKILKNDENRKIAYRIFTQKHKKKENNVKLTNIKIF